MRRTQSDRQAEAARAQQMTEEAQEPVGVEGAIVNGRVYADRLERNYNFECEGGPLYLCNEWVEFRRCFEWLAAQEPVLLNGLTEDETSATASVMGLTAFDYSLRSTK